MEEYMQQIRALQRKRSLVTICLQNVYNAVGQGERERGKILHSLFKKFNYNFYYCDLLV